LIFEGVVWRTLPAGTMALHTGFILRAAGRWNRPGVYGCLYTALTREGALAEWEKYFSGVPAADRAPFDAVSLHVRVEPVLNLTESENQVRYELSGEALHGSGEAEWESCRRAADLARQQGYSAILSPSAALPGAANLNLYIDGLAANYSLDHGDERDALNY
jgi:RES domain-containing protein